MKAHVEAVMIHPDTRARIVVKAPVTSVALNDEGLTILGRGGHVLVSTPIEHVVSVTVAGGEAR